MKTKDKLVIGGHEFDSRFILGSGKYSMKLIEAAVRDAGALTGLRYTPSLFTQNSY